MPDTGKISRTTDGKIWRSGEGKVKRTTATSDCGCVFGASLCFPAPSSVTIVISGVSACVCVTTAGGGQSYKVISGVLDGTYSLPLTSSTSTTADYNLTVNGILSVNAFSGSSCLPPAVCTITDTAFRVFFFSDGRVLLSATQNNAVADGCLSPRSVSVFSPPIANCGSSGMVFSNQATCAAQGVATLGGTATLTWTC